MKREVLRKIALKSGADAVGFGEARIFEEMREVLQERDNLPFEQADVERRINPFLHFPQARGIVCILKAYRLYTNPLQKGEFKVTSSSVIDYHREVKGILRKLQIVLKSEGINSTIMCDTQGLLDKLVAFDAGLGFIGKNSLLIHPKWGSAFHIGYLLTDSYWGSDSVDDGGCRQCIRCIEACPKGAIRKEGGLDHHLCLSGVTQNRKASKQFLEGYLYGCDICLRACPHNQVLERDESFIYREDDFSLSHSQFQLQYAQKEFAWLGRNLLLRNIQWNLEEDQ